MDSPNYSGKNVIVICGPTAVGKTALAVALAQKLKTEIINADSRQLYTELNIGVAKPSAQELNTVPHHLIGTISVTQLFGAGDFEKKALACVQTLFKKYNTLVLCGGTGMYIKAFCEGLDELPKADEAYREELNQAYKKEGIDCLQKTFLRLDPEGAHNIDFENPQRLMRALEIMRATGKPYSQILMGKKIKRPFNIVKIGINMNREQLYKRINHRVDVMMNEGLLNEVKALQPFWDQNALKTVGYNELKMHLKGECTLENAVEKIKQHTRNYAKRQLTWFKADKEVTWFEPTQEQEIYNFVLSKIS